MRSENRLLYASLAIAIVVVILFLIAGNVATLFLLSLIAAYLIHPFVNRMERRGIPRATGTLLVTGSIVLIILAGFIVLSPTMAEQMKGSLSNVHFVVANAFSFAERTFAPYLAALNIPGLEDLADATSENAVKDIAAPLASSVVTGGMAFAEFMVLSALLPVITFYMVKDWPKLQRAILQSARVSDRQMIATAGETIDKVLMAYLRGQAWVCLCMMVLYSLGLFAAGLNYALLIGAVSGALKFLPYVGTVIAVAIASVVALGQSGWDLWLFGGIALTYLIGEIIENSILTPNLIGDRVHLPPVFVIFAVLLGGTLLGILGVFLAAPVFAISLELYRLWRLKLSILSEDTQTQDNHARRSIPALRRQSPAE